ncbi:hypothetical protein Peur_015303 [Populus x canadensis]
MLLCGYLCTFPKQNCTSFPYELVFHGVINGAAPNPVRLAEMCERLGNGRAGRRGFLQPPDFDLKAVLGEGATAVRTSTPSVSSRFPPHGTVLKQACWVRCKYWMDRGFFLLEPKSWVSSLNILV